MTKEEKQLLLRDLCARLPYGVKIELMPITGGKCTTLTPIILQDYFTSDDVNYLPYLRPLSNMTEEEKEELIKNFWGSHTTKDAFEELSWYLSKHFDVNGLIPKGLAIEITKKNNPYKK